MSSKLSIAQLLAELEAEVEHHRTQEAQHAQQETFHREQRAHHASGLQVAQERLEAFRTAAAAAGELVERRRAPTPPIRDEEIAKARTVTDYAALVVAGKEPDETFGARAVAQQINGRFSSKLRRPVGPRTVSSGLRRLAAAGRIHLVREGKGHVEALYAKGPKPAS